MRPSRLDILRALIPFIAAVIGFVVGLAAGGLAEALIVPLGLFLTGHSHPLRVLDESFRSNPMGLLAYAMIGGYLTTAFLGAMAAHKAARKLAARWNAQPGWSAASLVNPMRNVWLKSGRGTRTLLVALPLLTLILQTVSVRERQAALRLATSQSTPAKSAPIDDHGRILYTTFDEQRKISQWESVSFLATFGTFAYFFHLFRFKELVSQALAMRSARDQDRPGQTDHKRL